MSPKERLISRIPNKHKPLLKYVHVFGKTLYRYILLLSPTRQLQKVKFKKMKEIKLNVGCGKVKFPSWLNVDLEPSADFILDIRRKLPFGNSSISFIYCEHVFEHLTYDEGQRLLQEFFRCLGKDGVVRIAMPDLDYVVQKYSTDWRDQDWLTWPGNECVNTKGQMINISFRWWDHKYLYNEEDLRNQFNAAGFSNSIRLELNKSNRSELRGLETRKDSKLIMEAQK